MEKTLAQKIGRAEQKQRCCGVAEDAKLRGVVQVKIWRKLQRLSAASLPQLFSYKSESLLLGQTSLRRTHEITN